MSDEGHKIEDNETAGDGGLIFPVETEARPRKAGDREDLDLRMPSETRLDRKEKYAGLFTGALFLLFAIEILLYIVAAFVMEDLENMNAVFQVVFPVTSGFLASAVTYYLSTKLR